MYSGSAFEWASHVSSGYAEILRTIVIAATIFWATVSGMYFADRFGKPVGWVVGLVSFAMLFYIRQPITYAFALAQCQGYEGEMLDDCMSDDTDLSYPD